MNQFLLYCLSMIEDETEKSKFEIIYHAHRHSMLYAASQILRDQSLAEDAMQEAFLRIMKYLQKIDEKDCHKTRRFLVVVVRNIAINMYNKRKKQNEVFLFDDTEGAELSSDAAGASEDVQRIVTLIKRLPENYAHIMILRYLYDLSDSECAKLLKLSEATARKRLERGRKLLKEALEKEEAKERV